MTHRIPKGLFIGTSGWTSRSWGAGRFYPSGLPSNERLAFYAGQFNTVEVNVSFYRLPPGGMVQRWAEVVGEDFRFSLKMWRRITHEKVLKDCRAEIRQFVEAARPLGAKLAVILVQLPPNLGEDVDRLARFLEEYSAGWKGRAPRIAVEFRNPDWLSEEVYGLLDRYGAAAVQSDMPRCMVGRTNHAGFVYVRRHGPGGRYRGAYDPAAINADAAKVRWWLDEGREVFVYFNNTIEPHALENARELGAAL